MQTELRNHNVAAIVAGLLLLLATATAALMAWVVTRAPHLIVMAVSGDDARAIVLVLFDVVYEAFSTFIRYL
jgi:hypothetical protein